MERQRHPTHGHDHSHGADGPSKNTFKFHVSSPLTGQKPKGAQGGNLKPAKERKPRVRGGAVATTPAPAAETPKAP